MLIFSAMAAAAPLPNPDTGAVSACLIDADDNGVLYGKDRKIRIMPPASTTKDNDSNYSLRKWQIR